MTNRRFEPVSYRPFRTEPLIQEGLLPVAREGGEFYQRVATGLFNLAAAAGQRADRQAARQGAAAGQRAALDGRPQVDVTGGDVTGGFAAETGGQQLTGSKAEKAARAKAHLVKRGLSDVAAAGLVGQFAQESSFNTRAVNPGDGNDGSDSVGLAQWNGKRARALRSFAARAGKPVDDFELQLDFVLHELETSEKGVGRRLKAARSVEEATAAAIGYERPQGWTPQNPQGGHGWANRLAAARSVAGVAAPAGVTDPVTTAGTGGAPVARSAPVVSVSGGGFRPSGSDTIRGRAYDEAGVKTYVQLVDAEMRSTTSQVYEKYKDDPAGLEAAFGDLKGALAKDHIFPEIEADFEIGFENMAGRYLDQARDNALKKQEAEDRAAFIERTGSLETDQQQRLSDFDPKSDMAADGIAASQQAIDDHYDDAVLRGIMDPDDAAIAKAKSRGAAAVGFYSKQAEALDAAGVKAMREEMRKDFADGGIDGLDGEAWSTLDSGLDRLEKNKLAEQDRQERDFRERGDSQAARVAAGYDVDQAELAKLALDSADAPKGKETLRETYAKISAGKAISDLSVSQGIAHVAGLKKQYGKNATDAELRTLAFAEGMLEAKRKSIANDSVSYAEAQGIVPETPMLTDAQDAAGMETIMAARVKSASQAAAELETAPRYLKAGEAKALADAIRKNPETGVAIAGSIVAGAGDAAGKVLAEFGDDAPMVAEAGAIMAIGGSARAAEDVILGYGKGPDGKPFKDIKPPAAQESFDSVVGDSLVYYPKDAERAKRAAAAIARKRIADEGLDPTSDAALEIHARAVHEAAGALYDRGVQYGGFADFDRPGWFSGSAKIIVPSAIRADSFAELFGALTDDDVAQMKVQPKASPGPWSILGGATEQGLADTIRAAVPVAVAGGYAFALGDPAGDDPRFIEGQDGNIFVLDLLSLRNRLGPRVPGAFR